MAKKTNTKKQNSKKLSTSKRMKIKYAVSVLNENTLEEMYRVRLSGYNFFVMLMLFFIALFAIYSCLIIFTPLRHLLPENNDYALRKEVVNNAITIDSLETVVGQNQRYLDNITDIFSGNIPLDEDDNIDSITVKASSVKLMEKTNEEKAFCENFEEEEIYHYTTHDDNFTAISFFTPVHGLLLKPFDYAGGHNGIDISTDEGAAIHAVADGVVLSSGYDPKDGYYIEILHRNNVVSVYRCASETFKNPGDIVKAGDVIGIVGKHDVHETPVLHFEIWSSMQPQNPQNYIVLD